MTDQPSAPCAGFPDQCPNLLTVHPDPPRHEGGVRCGCNARQDLENSPIFITKTDISAAVIAPPPIVQINGANGQPIVTIHHDGRLEHGPDYQPDQAARQFWDAVEQAARSIQYGAPLRTRESHSASAGDPRQPAYDAVFAYIREQPRDFLPTTVVDRNAMIWRAVHAALDAMGAPTKEGA